MNRQFASFVIKHARIIILIDILVTLVAGIFLKDLRIEPDITQYLPDSDSVVQLFTYIGEQYHGNHLAMIVLKTDNVFTLETLKKIDYLTEQFKLVEGVTYVMSLTNMLDIKSSSSGIEIGRLIDHDHWPETDEQLQNLKTYVLEQDLYKDRIVSSDGQATLIICRLSDDADKEVTANNLRKIVKNAQLKEKVFFSGTPFQLIEISNFIIGDLKSLVPLMIVFMIIVLFISFRRWRYVLLPLISVLMSTIWTLGIMSLLHIPLTIISDIIPVVLIAVGSAYSIHILGRFNELKWSDDRIKSIETALSEIMVPVFFAALTTIIGFLAFIFGAYLSTIREFGIFASLGIFFSLVIALTFIPACWSIFKLQNSKVLDRGKIRKVVFKMRGQVLRRWILQNKQLIMIASIIIAGTCLSGIPRMQRAVDMLDYFKEGSVLRRTEKLMERKFGGSIPLHILVQGDMLEPTILNEIKKMEDFLARQENIHKPYSIVDFIERMNDVMGEGKSIPDTRDKVINLWFLLEGEELIEQLVNNDLSEGIIQATVVHMDTRAIKDLLVNIKNYVATIDTTRVKFSVTGMPSIYQSLDASIVKSQIQSLVIALLLIFVCLLFLMRSFTYGLIGFIPIVFTLILIFGFMGFSKTPLDIATVLVGSISIGIGIDYSLHFMIRYKRELHRQQVISDALNTTLKTTGKTILINLSTVSAGFLVLVFAHLIPLGRFGFLVALTMFGAGIGAITLLPSIIQLLKTKKGEKNA